MRIAALCDAASVPLVWRPFFLGPIFKLQGPHAAPMLNEQRRNYMWRDMERLTEKFGIPWKRPSVFPRNTTLALRVAAAHSSAPWIAQFVEAAFLANFRDDRDLNDEAVIRDVIRSIGENEQRVLHDALETDRRDALRHNTEEAIALGIFGAPNCVVDAELFWGEETLEDAVAWATRGAAASRSSA
jgi:2-hydroxychromene-2-carboxylate isomerase